MKSRSPIIYIVSDSVGETAEFVVKAASSQFNIHHTEIRRISYVKDRQSIMKVLHSAKREDALVVFTLVVPELQRSLIEEAVQQEVPIVDIMGPMIRQLSKLYQKLPKQEPGLIHKLDDAYFRKVEAIEFAVKYDDGCDTRGLLAADVVLIGISRTSKTPLSMYLAHKCLKVANVPLVPEVKPPNELYLLPSHRCIGLVIDPINLNYIRHERLKSLGLPSDSNYANMDRIVKELEYAKGIIEQIGCPQIDVSNKAVEETANIIINILKNNKKI